MSQVMCQGAGEGQQFLSAHGTLQVFPCLACCCPGQIHPSAILYAQKHRNAHLFIGHLPTHLTAALTQVRDHVQLVFRGFTIFSCYVLCAERAAALASAAFGKHFDPHTPQWALGRHC